MRKRIGIAARDSVKKQELKRFVVFKGAKPLLQVAVFEACAVPVMQ